MAWTTIPNANLEPDAPARSVDALALRDNAQFIRDGLGTMQVFTAGGTWNKPTDLTRVKVTVVGGGGGGYSHNLVSGVTGAPGGATIKTIEAGSLGASETVTVGAAVAQGVNGATSSFGAHCSATGGTGSGPADTSPNAGGVGAGGDINMTGRTSVLVTPTLTGVMDGPDAPVLGSFGRGGAADAQNIGGGAYGGTAGIVIVEEFF